MDNIKNLVLGAVVIVVVGLFAFGGASGPSATDVAKELANDVSKKLGALVGPDIPYPYLSVGGVKTLSFSSALNTASTTVCTFQPSATSTLVFASVRVDGAATTSTDTLEWQIGKDVLTTGTTTRFHITSEEALSRAANLPLTLIASTTVTQGGVVDPLIFAVQDKLNFVFEAPTEATAGAAAYHTLTGECKAVFIAN